MMDSGMNSVERRAASSLASLYALRMLGMFMIMPVFPFYAKELPDYSPELMGFAIGVYGLTQAIMQLPMGMWSDRFGRKRMIAAGFLLFAIGSLVAGSAGSLMMVVVGRALQGAGAVSAVLMAMAADLTREEQRTKVMGFIGASIGLSFAFSMVLGPLLNKWIHVPGLFFFTAFLAVLGLVAVKFWVPDPKQTRFHRDTELSSRELGALFLDPQLVRLNSGIFVLHFVLTSCFVVIPLAIAEAGLPKNQHWELYLPVVVLAMVIMFPFIIVAEKKRRMKQVFLLAIASLCVCMVAFAFSLGEFWLLSLCLLLFFAAFNVLEASLPSLLVKTVSADKKGTAMGIYSSAQFIGTFLGGWIGGNLFGKIDIQGVFFTNSVLLLVWFLFACTMKRPRYLSSHMLHVGKVTEAGARELVIKITQVRGVAEAVVAADEGVAYLKVDKHALDLDALGEFSSSQA